MPSDPSTGKPNTTRFVLGMVVMVGWVGLQLATGKFFGEESAIPRASRPALYWTGVISEIAIVLVVAGVFLYQSMTRR